MRRRSSLACDDEDLSPEEESYNPGTLDVILDEARSANDVDRERFRQLEQKLGLVLGFTGVMVALLAPSVVVPRGEAAHSCSVLLSYALVVALVVLLAAVVQAFWALKTLPMRHLALGDIVTDKEMSLDPNVVKGRLASSYYKLTKSNRGPIERKVCLFDGALRCAVIGTVVAILALIARAAAA